MQTGLPSPFPEMLAISLQVDSPRRTLISPFKPKSSQIPATTLFLGICPHKCRLLQGHYLNRGQNSLFWPTAPSPLVWAYWHHTSYMGKETHKISKSGVQGKHRVSFIAFYEKGYNSVLFTNNEYLVDLTLDKFVLLSSCLTGSVSDIPIQGQVPCNRLQGQKPKTPCQKDYSFLITRGT